MYNKIRQLIYQKFFQDIAAVQHDEINRLKARVNELTEELGDPRHVVKNLLKRDISWFDYKELKMDEQKGYVQAADGILKNATFQNEVNHACADIINDIAKSSISFEDVMAKRMTLNGIILLKERLEELGVDSLPERKNPYSAI
jgi:arginyl-tRNA synthetase